MSTNVLRVWRIEKRMYERLINAAETSAKVGHIYENGFDLIQQDNRIIHFRTGKRLAAPFAVLVAGEISKWKKDVTLKEGDLFCLRTPFLCRVTYPDCRICLDPVQIIDLKRTLPYSPSADVLVVWLEVLIEEIARKGKPEGIGGTLTLLQDDLPALASRLPSSLSMWSVRALPRVKKLLVATVRQDLVLFEEAWESLSGLGPGLTPSGDDFLVGFLAAHKLFSSRFGKLLEKRDTKIRLKERVRFKTVPVAFEFLDYGLEGFFSEMFYCAFCNLIAYHGRMVGENALLSSTGDTEALSSLLEWGHSSGTDALTGAVIGFWSMRN
jgi:hypothetical protein